MDFECGNVSGGVDWDFGQLAEVSLSSGKEEKDTHSVLYCANEVAAGADGIHRIFTIPKVGEKLKQDSIPLTYTPRKFVGYPYNNIFYSIETDHRTYGPAAIKRIVEEKVSFAYSLTMSQKCAWLDTWLTCN